VLAAVEPYLGVDLVALDIDGLYEAVHALPWVTQAKIRRRWPDGVWVRVAEREAIARWGEAELISPTGEVFAVPVETIPEGLVRLYGPQGTERELLAAYASTRRMLATVDVEIDSLWIDPRGAWHLRVNNGLELLLGRQELNQRVLRFVDVVLGSLAPRLIEAQYIDLRYGNGFAVGWRPQPEEKEADVEKT
jgi:cell division protein FtsQ